MVFDCFCGGIMVCWCTKRRWPRGHPAGAAHRRGAQSLRLFTLPVNTPAIRFYERAGFTRAAGVHEEVIDAALTLREYGFEIETADGKNKTETEL